LKSIGNSYAKIDLKRESPNLGIILLVSLGLVFFAILSSTLVYAETASVQIGGNSFDVEYVGNGVTVNGIESDLDFISLIFSVDVTSSSGVLQVTFDRSFFDSVYMGNDDDFIVLADGDEPSYSEIETTAESRTLSITLPSGTEEVEIIGSVFGNPKSEPEVTEPEVTEPEVTEPEVTEPEVTEPEVTEPETTETPKPKPETPKDEVKETKPKVECGPGTILKEGICVLDQKCGPGTILKDGICVVKSDSSASTETLGKQLVYGLIAAFVIAGVVGIILALMSKASKSS